MGAIGYNYNLAVAVATGTVPYL